MRAAPAYWAPTKRCAEHLPNHSPGRSRKMLLSHFYVGMEETTPWNNIDLRQTLEVGSGRVRLKVQAHVPPQRHLFYWQSDLCAFGCPSLMDYKALNNASHERRAPQTCLEPDRLLGIKLMSSPQRVLIYSDCAHPLFGSRSQALSATTEQFRNRHFNNDQNSSNSSSS